MKPTPIQWNNSFHLRDWDNHLRDWDKDLPQEYRPKEIKRYMQNGHLVKVYEPRHAGSW